MKEHLLNPSDRAALQGLITLAGTVGVGALLARLMPAQEDAPDRHLGFVLFEVFCVVAILGAAATTAYASIWLLHHDEAISSGDLSRAAAPLVFSLILLVLLVAVSKLAKVPGWIDVHFPTLLATLTLGAALGVSVVFFPLEPGELVAAAAGILAMGGCVSWFYSRVERFGIGRKRRASLNRVAALAAAGYLPKAGALRPALPRVAEEASALTVRCWTHGERVFLDQESAGRLAKEVNRQWTEFADGNAVTPINERLLTDVNLRTRLLPWPPKFVMTVSLRPKLGDDPTVHPIEVGDRGLFELTDLGIID